MSRSTILTRILGVSMVGVLLAGCLALPKSDRTMFQEPLLAEQGHAPAQGGPDDAHGRPAGRGARVVSRHRGLSGPDHARAPDGPERGAALLVDRTRFARRRRHPAGRDPLVRVEAALRLGSVRPRSRVSRRHRYSRRPFDAAGSSSPSTSWTRRPISGSPRTRRPQPTATRTGSTDIRTSPRAATGTPTARSAASSKSCRRRSSRTATASSPPSSGSRALQPAATGSEPGAGLGVGLRLTGSSLAQ